MTPGELLRLLPGDRAPALRQAARRMLASLDEAEAAACVPGAKPSRSLAIRRKRLQRLARLADCYRIALPAAVAARIHPEKGRHMTSSIFPSLFEDLTDAPLHQEFQRLLRAMIERGEPAVEMIEAAFATVTAACVDAEGLVKISVRLMHVGSVLGGASPEVQAAVATEQRKAGATAH